MSRRLRSVSAPVAEDLAAQHAALDVPCPRCAAPVGACCVNTITGAPVHRSVSHWQRLRAATPTEGAT